MSVGLEEKKTQNAPKIPAKLRRLFTHEDFHGFHLHKMLGILVLCHFFYRIIQFHYLWPQKIDEANNLIIPRETFVFWTLIHLSLNVSSFVFNVPVRRFQMKPMIWKEFQIHNLIFTARSCIPMLLWHFGYQVVNPFLVLGFHVLA